MGQTGQDHGFIIRDHSARSHQLIEKGENDLHACGNGSSCIRNFNYQATYLLLLATNVDQSCG